MKKRTVIINKKEYELVRNDGDCFDEDVVLERITDYFYDYDYIFMIVIIKRQKR